MYYKEVTIDSNGDFDSDDLDSDEISCVEYLIESYEDQGLVLTKVFFDDDGYTVTVDNPEDLDRDDDEEESGDLADFDTQED